MRITKIAIHIVELTSHVAYRMAGGKACETVESVVVRLETDEGLTGWGEVCPIPRYLPAYARGVPPAVEELAPVLLGADPLGPEALMGRCEVALPGHPYAKSAIDMALWDLTGKAAGMPLYRLLGGRQTDSVPLYHSISCIAPDEMARIAETVYADDIRQFQVKLGADGDWQADVARIRAVREAVGPGPLIFADWNCGATALTAIRTARAIRDLDVMLEQPCESLDACAQVRNATGCAMKIDEGAHDMATLLEAHRLGCMDVVAVKFSKFGGVSAARRARDLCLHLGTMVMIEDVWGSDIATAAAAHLAVATAPAYLLNACDLSGYVTPRIAPDGPVRKRGRLAPSDRPGLGVSPEPDTLGDAVAVYA
ncbi:MAG: enolase C-terminal domain-like protein [Alphaproteobacteria bacterium]|nr:enolase C-terminal domain-like protein [Alphaproteobacteria bacterium]